MARSHSKRHTDVMRVAEGTQVCIGCQESSIWVIRLRGIICKMFACRVSKRLFCILPHGIVYNFSFRV